MKIKLSAPGIDCELKNAVIACRIIGEVLDYIFYDEPQSCISISSENGEVFAVVEADADNNGFLINKHFFCIPDANDVVSEMICKRLES